jgi:DNA-binding transcriptional LysR family regulator
MRYRFHPLKGFMEVVEKQRITKSPEELDLTQPTFSIQLKRFSGSV